MECAELMPKTTQKIDESNIVDKNFDWKTINLNYSNEEIEKMYNWVNLQKQIINEKEDTTEMPIVEPEQLNKYQRFAFDIIKQFKEEKKQLLMILLGTAGTGKSFTVSAISTLQKNAIIRASPTAKAAFLIRGETVHSTFYIPCTNNDKDALIPLKNHTLAKIQDEFKNIQIVIIDEFSMLSTVMFGKMDLRLQQAKNNLESFGGISILLIGDPGQLLPVGGSPLYISSANNLMATAGNLAYKKFEIVISLEAMMRQQNLDNDEDQAKFIDLLPRLRNGTSTIDDWHLLRKRMHVVDIENKFEESVHIYNINTSVNTFNIEKLKNLNMPITELIATNAPTKCMHNN